MCPSCSIDADEFAAGDDCAARIAHPQQAFEIIYPPGCRTDHRLKCKEQAILAQRRRTLAQTASPRLSPSRLEFLSVRIHLSAALNSRHCSGAARLNGRAVRTNVNENVSSGIPQRDRCERQGCRSRDQGGVCEAADQRDGCGNPSSRRRNRRAPTPPLRPASRAICRKRARCCSRPVQRRAAPGSHLPARPAGPERTAARRPS